MIRRWCAVLAVVAMPGSAFAWQSHSESDATPPLVERARARHVAQASRITAFRANVVTRMEGAAGAGRFGKLLPLVAFETVSRVHWQPPNDLRVDVLGMRSRTVRIPGFSERGIQVFWTDTFTSEPWFVPRSFGDAIQILGIPEVPAVHPLARDGDRYYTYAITDSVTLSLPGRTVHAVAVQVRPREYGPMLVSGLMWLDADSLDVVRLSVAFVGDGLWEDEDPESPKLVQLEADLEYALHQGRFWLPLRQILTGAWTYRRYMPGATLTSSAVTTFRDYEIDPDTALVFASTGRTSTRGDWRWDWEWGEACDGPRGFQCGAHERLRADRWDGGRWEVHLPSLDSLLRYDFGSAFARHRDLLDDDLIAERLTELAAQSEALPNQWSGRRLLDLDWTKALRFVGFNRVQGVSFALATALRPGLAFTTLNLAGRVSTADERVTGSATWRRAAPRGVFELSAFHELREVEPWTHGLGIGNTFKALLLGHDDADYYLSTGAGVRFVGERGAARHFTFSFAFERQQSVVRASGSALHDAFFGDGVFPENPAIREGDFVRVRAERFVPLAGGGVRLGVTTLSGEQQLGAQAWTGASWRFPVRGRDVRLGLRLATVVGDRSPQLDLRLGGPATVRGHAYGVRRGRALWASQVDVTLNDHPWAAPVVFADAGGLFDGEKPLVGLGAGASLFKGWMRIDVAKSITTGAPVRIDVMFRAPR